MFSSTQQVLAGETLNTRIFAENPNHLNVNQQQTRKINWGIYIREYHTVVKMNKPVTHMDADKSPKPNGQWEKQCTVCGTVDIAKRSLKIYKAPLLFAETYMLLWHINIHKYDKCQI